jgi:hypothetical protein
MPAAQARGSKETKRKEVKISNKHVLEGPSQSNTMNSLYIKSLLWGKDGVKERLIVMDPVEGRVAQLCERAAYRHMVKDIKSQNMWRSITKYAVREGQDGKRKL